jgi:ABC-type sugar transport systems, ATPase components
VDVCEMMGSSMHLHVNANDKDIVLVLQTVDLPPEKRAGFAYGETISFTFQSDLMHLFSAETQRNLI